MDASRIAADWHDWLHYRTDEIPNESDKKPNWYKIHKENATGTIEAYNPDESKEKEPGDVKKLINLGVLSKYNAVKYI